MVTQNMCFIIPINNQYVINKHANKQILNSENWSLSSSVTKTCKYLKFADLISGISLGKNPLI